MTAPRITAATTNRAKLEELKRLIGEIATPAPPPFDKSDPIVAGISEESGDTFEEIAATKAVAWSRLLEARGLDSLTIASDGGLLIPALGSAWNPLRTRRFAGEQASDLERSRQLLDLARNIDGDERTISWQEAVAIADRGQLIDTHSASGSPGRLARTVDEAGLGCRPGFWVPSVWEVPEFGFRRLSQLNPSERARLNDHWAALREPVRAALSRYLAGRHLTEPNW